MFQKKLFFYFLIIFIGCGSLWSNPIPVPLPASMPLEDMKISIVFEGNGLVAYFSGEFTFDYIPVDEQSMLFPVPPDAHDIHVWQSGVEKPWTWNDDLYPTVLPEHPEIPMIEWRGPFPEWGCVFRVDYVHSLIKRGGENIFFYANGTGKYLSTYEKTTTALFDITLPPGHCVNGLWRDETPYNYQLERGHLTMTVQSMFGPIVKDVILSLSDEKSACDNIEPVFTFKAGPAYYFQAYENQSIDTIKEVICTDLNWDNNPDIIVGIDGYSDSPDLVSILTGDFVKLFGFEVPGELTKLSAADLDGDKDTDLVVMDSKGKTLSLYLNNGYGEFFPGTIISGLDLRGSLDIADFNLDGNNDLAVTIPYSEPEGVYIFYNNGDADFAEPVILPVNVYSDILECEDLNGDSYPDILTASSRIVTILNNGNGGFGDPVIFEGAAYYRSGLGDIDDDGDLDILASGGSMVSVLVNNGEGVFSPGESYAVRPGPSEFFLTDLNADNLKDFAVGGENYRSEDFRYVNTVTMLRNQGDTFKPDRDIIFSNSGTSLSEVVDLNNDSLPDLLIAGKDENNQLYLQIRYCQYSPLGYTSGLGDVNENGTIDIVDALIVAQYYVGLNPASFTAPLAVGDVNADGDVNIVDALTICQFYVGLLTKLPGEPRLPPTPSPTPNPTPVPGGKYLLHVESLETIKGIPVETVIRYTGDYSDYAVTPFDIGPYSEPFTVRLSAERYARDTSGFGCIFSNWVSDPVDPAYNQSSYIIMAMDEDNPEKTSVARYYDNMAAVATPTPY